MGKINHIEEKIRKYELFVEEKLKMDLKQVEDMLQIKNNMFQEWEEVQNMSKTVQNFKVKDQDMFLRIKLENCVLTHAEVNDYDTVLVDIGLGMFLEMEPEEALKYSQIRQKALKREVEHFRKLAIEIKVHIKLVLLALHELQALQPSRMNRT